MSRPTRFALRFLVIASVITVMAIALPPSFPASSPYLSALSSLAAAPVSASQSCPNSGCSSFGLCGKVKGSTCRFAAGECQQTAC